MFNLVGCQTKLTYPAQAVCFRKVPGLEHAEFVRFGSMHRNTYVNAPVSLNEELALKSRPNVHLAGQITGVEGYVESIACGLWVGQMLAAKLAGRSLPKPRQRRPSVLCSTICPRPPSIFSRPMCILGSCRSPKSA